MQVLVTVTLSRGQSVISYLERLKPEESCMKYFCDLVMFLNKVCFWIVTGSASTIW